MTFDLAADPALADAIGVAREEVSSLHAALAASGLVAWTAGNISMTVGQRRVNPADGHFVVASTPILEPKLGIRLA